MNDLELEFKYDFLREAKDLLTQAESSFMSLESDPTNMTLVDAIFRFAHNLKGTSRAVGFGQIAELTHVAENLLLKIKQGDVLISPPLVDVLLQFNDKVTEMIDGLQADLTVTFETADLIHQLSHPNLPQVPRSDHTPEVVQDPPSAINFPEEDEVPDSATEEPSELELPTSVDVAPPPTKAPATKKQEPRKDDETIRVSLQRLERVSDLVGELVILQSVVDRAIGSSPSEQKTKRALSKICKDIQDMTMSLRMVPVGGAFQKLQRIVRDTSKMLGKKVSLRIIGEETEIDRTVLEQLGDPLVHLVRNAVDHGIEAPHDRLLCGKEEAGVVEVMAFHEGSFLVIQITDDGAGIDPARILKKAKEKKIITTNQSLSEQETLNLIFHPGFSTKDQVSEVSGRGVGMDVVKTNIEALGGTIKLQSRFGTGSSVRLVLPLTMAIIDGILISAAGERIVLPRSQVHEISKVDPKSIHLIAGKTTMYQLRDEVLPMFSLSADFGHPSKKEAIALIIRTGARAFAVSVDDVLRQQQVVVKPPTAEISGRSGMMGTTILGDGKPALIIDLIDFYAKQTRRPESLKVS